VPPAGAEPLSALVPSELMGRRRTEFCARLGRSFLWNRLGQGSAVAALASAGRNCPGPRPPAGPGFV